MKIPMYTRACETCGTQFHPRPLLVRSGGGRWCSTRCYGNRNGSELERLWLNVRRSEGCWEWTANVNHRGYGLAKFNGKTRIAHRVFWELEHGPIPFGLFACHHCDNPPCVRASHLFLGTASDNMRDASRKGRMLHGKDWDERVRPTLQRGDQHHAAVVTADQVQQMRAEYVAGRVTYEELGRKYGTDRTNVSLIVRGKTWTHLL